jgi:malate dehydrogenase (quinone)
MNSNHLPQNIKTDVLIIGAGIMGATLAALLKELDPNIQIDLIEKLENTGLESSNTLNNAGTGHAGYCELNYTPQMPNGSINIQKALEINSKFEISLQFWSYLSKKYTSFKPKNFISKVPHISIVRGKKDVEFLKNRYLALKKNHLFNQIEFTTNPSIIHKWAPLVASKNMSEPIGATRFKSGSDIDFGSLTKELIKILAPKKYFKLHKNLEALSIKKFDRHRWRVTTKGAISKKEINFKANFVFITSGGDSLRLLQRTNIPEQLGYAGFPVNGKWLICNNPKINLQHTAKVYGKAQIGSPPMSMPHMDLRVVNGRRVLLFGPFASFTCKFLNSGSQFDLIKSIKFHNIKPIVSVLLREWKLLIYLIKQTIQSNTFRMNELRRFYPEANCQDWTLISAGKRVQIIKPSKKFGGTLEFGTEIIFNTENNLAALLGASPGASVSASSMIEIIEKCFKEKIKTKHWQGKLKKIIPVSSAQLIKDPNLVHKIRTTAFKMLYLN